VSNLTRISGKKELINGINWQYLAATLPLWEAARLLWLWE